MTDTSTKRTPAPFQWTGPAVMFGPPLAIVLVTLVIVGFVYTLGLGYDFLLWQLDQPLLHSPVAWLLCHPLIGGDIGLAIVSHNGLNLSVQQLNDQMSPLVLLSFALKMFAAEAMALGAFLAAMALLVRGGLAVVPGARKAPDLDQPNHD